MTTLHFMVGLPCSGKTTRARELEREHNALRLTPDEWHLRFFGDDTLAPEHDKRHDSVEAVMWEVAVRALALGCDVIIDFGLWSAQERAEFLERGRSLGVMVRFHYMEAPAEVLYHRLEERNRARSGGTFTIPREEMARYIGLFEVPTDEERAQDEWNTCAQGGTMIYFQSKHLRVRSMMESDIDALHQGFAAQGWEASKPRAQFVRYLALQEEKARDVLIAEWEGQAVGYVMLVPQAEQGPFAGKGIPEIVDFNVLQAFQRRGIGTALLDAAEDIARRSAAAVSLGVGLYEGYGAAQRMYARRGYVPDGSGAWYDNAPVVPGQAYPADDSLVLYLSKRLGPHSTEKG